MRLFIQNLILGAALAVGATACVDTTTENELRTDEQLTSSSVEVVEAFAIEAHGFTAGPIKQKCMVTGCSGQVCANQPVYTTCQWLPEYACYHEAECAVQADGNCGWTQTPELLACLSGTI